MPIDVRGRRGRLGPRIRHERRNEMAHRMTDSPDRDAPLRKGAFRRQGPAAERLTSHQGEGCKRVAFQCGVPQQIVGQARRGRSDFREQRKLAQRLEITSLACLDDELDRALPIGIGAGDPRERSAPRAGAWPCCRRATWRR